MKKNSIAIVCFGITAFSAVPAWSQVLGYGEITGSYTEGDRGDNEPTDDFSTIGIAGAVAYAINPQMRLAFDIALNANNGGEDIFDGQEVGNDGEIAVHFLYDLSAGATIGAYLSGGIAQSERDEPLEEYPFASFGIEGSMAFNEQWSGYAQLAAVDQSDDDLGSGGYKEGYALRLGGTYQFNESTSFYADVQYGEAKDYEDADEDGEFARLALGGETLINATDWAVTYEISRESYVPDEGADSNDTQVVTATLGARYYFGGARPSDLRDAGVIGTPDIVSRASLFTSAAD
ncbi:hypothetical protein [Yoonia sp. BS5-3]|uniref:Porin n=1 Tax=Yoonia phaeophyticola TaxID=3137369 RepID=A0ABZ2V2V0_9RHOB